MSMSTDNHGDHHHHPGHQQRHQQQQQQQQQQVLKKRSVVSCFIFKFPNKGGYSLQEKPSVALFRRSEKVSTYCHCLAPISGSIDSSDANPLATAWREIGEETTLTPSSLSLFRQGKPYTFGDPSVGREWTIYPFAFRLKARQEGGCGEEGIRTDWEHEGWEWRDPDAVVMTEDEEALGGVPRLKESLRRVWPEGEIGGASSTAGRTLAAGLQRLRDDRESGARQLAAIALNTFRDVLAEITGSGSGQEVSLSIRWDIMRMIAWHLWKNGRESMGASILNALIAVLIDIEPVIINGQPDQILGRINALIEMRKSTTARLRDVFASYIRGNILANKAIEQKRLTILTLSASSTIHDSIAHAVIGSDADIIDLRILESRPLYEGVRVASSMLSDFHARGEHHTRLDVSIYTDASAALASAGVDILLLGADRIASDGSVSNKTGSLPAALSVRHVSPSTRVVVLSELEKVAEPGNASDHVVEEGDPVEVTKAWQQAGVKGADVLDEAWKEQPSESRPDVQATVSVKNISFEWVPSTLIDAYVCEEGVQRVDQIKERSVWVGRQIERFFSSL